MCYADMGAAFLDIKTLSPVLLLVERHLSRLLIYNKTDDAMQHRRIALGRLHFSYTSALPSGRGRESFRSAPNGLAHGRPPNFSALLVF